VPRAFARDNIRAMKQWTYALMALAIAGCGDDEERTPAPRQREEAPPPETPEPPSPPPEEACAQVIVVAWQGAQSAPPTVTRTEDEARARAEELRARLEQGERFNDLARAESDARSSGPRGGLLGTYSREDWPPAHQPIMEAIFRLQENMTTEVLHAPYGWVIGRRCRTERIHTRHILVRYAGARNAPEDITRTRDEARALAEQLHGRVAAPMADFAALAREHSEDSSAERGGDLGTLGRGRLAEAYEAAAWALQDFQTSTVVETEFGFHVIQRLPLEN
jgi:parvulin-like peptidyl-prolyl isomerase